MDFATPYAESTNSRLGIDEDFDSDVKMGVLLRIMSLVTQCAHVYSCL